MAHEEANRQLQAISDDSLASAICSSFRNRPAVLSAVNAYLSALNHEGAGFFTGLRDDEFHADEEGLRDRIFEFFAAWSHPELASLSDIVHDPGVQRCRANFLTKGVPKDVALMEWIDRRIGGEVDLRFENGRWVAHVTDSAKPYIREKMTQMRQRERERNAAAPPPPPAGGPRAGASRDAPAAGAKGGGKGASGAPQAAPRPAPPAPQAAAAAGGVATKEESASGGKKGGKDSEKGKGKDKGKDKGKANAELSSPKAEEFLESLPEDELLEGELALRQALLDHVAAAGDQPVLLALAGKDKAVASSRANLLPPEVPLRLWIEGRIGGELLVRRNETGKYVLELKGADDSNPASGGGADSHGNGVGSPDANGEVPPPPEEAAAAEADDGAADGDGSPERLGAQNDFFSQLPEDGFTQKEERLREALLRFIDEWPHEAAPLLCYAGSDPEIRAHKAALLPRNVTLRSWIDNRIGGELETVTDATTNDTVFHYCGKVVIGSRRPPPPIRSKLADNRGSTPKGAGKKGFGKGGKAVSRAGSGDEPPWKRARGE